MANIDIAKVNAAIAAALPDQMKRQQEVQDKVANIASFAGLDLPGKVGEIKDDFCTLSNEVVPFIDFIAGMAARIFPGKVARVMAWIKGVEELQKQIYRPQK